MCPIIWHDLIGLFLIMKKADYFERTKENKEQYNNLVLKYENHTLFEDIKFDNIGVINKQIVLIDYGGIIQK